MSISGGSKKEIRKECGETPQETVSIVFGAGACVGEKLAARNKIVPGGTSRAGSVISRTVGRSAEP